MSQPAPESTVSPATLEERILAAEQRLLAREARLRQQTTALGQRLHRATQPGRLLWPLLGGVVSVWGARWALRHWAPARSGTASAALGIKGASGLATQPGERWWQKLPWLSVFSWAWPLLPLAWRAQVSPRLASWAIAVGVPLTRQLFRPAPPPTPPLP